MRCSLCEAKRWSDSFEVRFRFVNFRGSSSLWLALRSIRFGWFHGGEGKAEHVSLGFETFGWLDRFVLVIWKEKRK